MDKHEIIRGILRKYLLDDCLRPEYDGMTAWGMADIILKALEPEVLPTPTNHDCKGEKCKVCLKTNGENHE